jgi:hypothetical protein
MQAQILNLVSWVILGMLSWLGLFVIPAFLLRRAIRQVISMFRRNHSLCSESPKTVHELGLARQSLMDRFWKPRDYKPYALQFLVGAGVVRETEDARLCLLEDKMGQIRYSNA